MCLIVLAIKVHPKYKLVLAANRDEFYERPSAPARFWQEAPELLAGRDLKAGGTWLGITRRGRLGMITNYRDPASLKKSAPSRGQLLARFLKGRQTPWDYLQEVRLEGERYNGFNLIVGDQNHLYWYSNRNGRPSSLDPGVYGLSNHLLNTPWPKVTRGKERMAEILAAREEDLDLDDLLKLLEDRHRPPDDRLPDTGVGLEWERILSPIFISSPTYGTRSSTGLLIDHEDRAAFVERSFNSHGKPISSVKQSIKLD
jgi:uncharacterized protein with NRDE domain